MESSPGAVSLVEVAEKSASHVPALCKKQLPMPTWLLLEMILWMILPVMKKKYHLVHPECRRLDFWCQGWIDHRQFCRQSGVGNHFPGHRE